MSTPNLPTYLEFIHAYKQTVSRDNNLPNLGVCKCICVCSVCTINKCTGIHVCMYVNTDLHTHTHLYVYTYMQCEPSSKLTMHSFVSEHFWYILAPCSLFIFLSSFKVCPQLHISITFDPFQSVFFVTVAHTCR